MSSYSSIVSEKQLQADCRKQTISCPLDRRAGDAGSRQSTCPCSTPILLFLSGRRQMPFGNFYRPLGILQALPWVRLDRFHPELR
jgi:hypothetical protein